MAKPTKVDLVGVGLNATDTVIPLSTYPARGSKVEYSTSTVLPGGQVATTVVACQHWGLRTRYVGKLGDDLAATLHREAFSHSGVETRVILIDSFQGIQNANPISLRGRIPLENFFSGTMSLLSKSKLLDGLRSIAPKLAG